MDWSPEVRASLETSTRPRAHVVRPAVMRHTCLMRAPLCLSSLPVTAALVLGCFGCASTAGPEEVAPAVASSSGTGAIAKLVSRDRSITLLAGRGTVRATVLDGDGNLIAREVPLDDLQAIDATAYDACHSSFAGLPQELDAHVGGNAASTASVRGR